MKNGACRTTGICVVVAAVGVPLAAQTLADVQKVTDPSGSVVTYPTRLAEIVTATRRDAVDLGSPIGAGDAVLTQRAYTHVVLRPGEPEAVLSPNTFVRFDTVNTWLMRAGAMLLLTQRAKLSLVVAGLTTIFVNSQVYVEVTSTSVLVHVLEGHVVLGPAGTGLALKAAETGRLFRGGAPERFTLSNAERARIDSEIQKAQRIRAQPPSPAREAHEPKASPEKEGGGGGGGKTVALVLGLGAAGAATYYFLNRDDTPDVVDKPDLVPFVNPDGTLCQPVAGARGMYTVRVSNAGKATAPPSATLLAPGKVPPQAIQTNSIAAGNSFSIGPLLLASCGSPCNIDITVDSANQVDESNEGNNFASGRCF